MASPEDARRRTGYDVTDVTAEDVLSALRSAEPPTPGAGVLWWLYAGRKPGTPYLVAGLNGTRGSLVWHENGQTYLPADGDGEGLADYFSLQGAHFPQPAGSEVSAEAVLRAVRELCESQARPAGTAWKPA
ncbi:Imm1 family immunity protein [Amycolatopsis benzoatilytica]|uniref:Imm1 family immunity protein n=1 Tax=Amycolatopsis benzoatilytica TaxID=346045 RepID=UPI0003639C9D|nr:Imm1 family immunity protein [Amycolatopsis benzoatilytica]